MDRSPSIEQTSRFLRACAHQPVDATPVWLMRQAGRYMRVYQELRQRYGFWQIIKTPELACEVTLQPIRAFDLDAAIIFGDTLPLLEAMGLQIEFVNREESPLVLHNPIRSAADVAALTVTDPRESLWFTFQAITLTRAELQPLGIPLIGFSGAPFTLASYAIEGAGHGARRHLHAPTKALMMQQPAVWRQLMTSLTQMISAYLIAQVHAGAQALCLFDSRVDVLSTGDYRDYVLPYTQQIMDHVRSTGVPLIHVGTNSAGMIDYATAIGCTVLGVDWRIDLATVYERLGSQVALQGNLDPLALFATWPELRRRAEHVLQCVNARPGHIFNLGAPIVPSPPEDNIRRLVAFVHEYSARQRSSANNVVVAYA
jgi:uroporphyrinogen decarboxylase